jgi:murein DD-endopeptidase MepM/ murein hydrolase activator NlpD
MRTLMRFLATVIAIALAVVGGAWWWAGRAEGPAIDVKQPGKFIGRATALEMSVQAPEGEFSRVDVVLEQNGQSHQVFTLDQQGESQVKQEAADRLYVMRPVGKLAIPELKSGPARLTIRASRPVLYGLRHAETMVVRDLEVRLEPPRVAPVSTFHYVNHGGSEFVVYRVTPEGASSGVRVGDIEYAGFPAKGAGITSDPALRVAFFALLYDQDLNTPIRLFARDEAGNETTIPLDHMVFPKPYARSRIELNDAFLQRVVPAIANASPDEGIATDDILGGFLTINGDLRRKNNALVASLAAKTSPDMKFMDAFQQLGDSQVEARFADTRTYVYKGKEVDKQVHLGFDLAVTAQVPIAAAHRGTVVHAGDLGIYGNCVVVDHGLGVQSLYGHLSSIGVEVGDSVEKGQTLGRSGMTGLAGGDHLHFTMLVGGQQVTPVDWWSSQWMQDRVLRKIAAAGGPASPLAPAP